jgi:hypothetical protein
MTPRLLDRSPQWCRHLRENVVRHGPSLWWCGRCGALWSGEERENGRRRWRMPQVSKPRNSPSAQDGDHAEDIHG